MNIKNTLTGILENASCELSMPCDVNCFFEDSSNKKFGDYQSNAAFLLSKHIDKLPMEIAELYVASLQNSHSEYLFTATKPGFINAQLKDDFVCSKFISQIATKKLGVASDELHQTIVVDYSHPNLAKEMHVGHLRSTIIGDAIVKIFEFKGHDVIRQNHMGDWGTQFGMLIAFLSENIKNTSTDELKDLEEYYRNSKQRFDADSDFADQSRAFTVKLQSGDEECLSLWRKFIEISINHCDLVYQKLDVSLNREHVYPESAYNSDLPNVISDLEEKGLIHISKNAKCVFLKEFSDDEGNIQPIIVQKSDEGYLYATTDLAAVRYRTNILNADRLIYVVDSRQTLHLKQVFAIARAAKFIPDNVSFEHMAFGTMLGENGKPFKTREGSTVKLLSLLEEAELKARAIVDNKSPDLDETKKHHLSHVIGIGAVKYADLSKSRINDYIFDLDQMLSLEGNTAPYLQYAYTRIISLFRKSGLDINNFEVVDSCSFKFEQERNLAMLSLRFPEIIDSIVDSGQPHVLCNYLYSISKSFMSFYEKCPVLVENSELKYSRLTLCFGTARIIKTGLSLLGISVVDEM